MKSSASTNLHATATTLWQIARYALVLAIVLAHLLLVAIQSMDFAPLWLSELTRYLPYYWILPPLLLAVLLSVGLGWGVLLAAAGNVLLFATVTMGGQWNFPPAQELPGVRLRVLSYNVKAWDAKRRQDGFTEIDQEVRRHMPDIVALQDADGWLPERSDTSPVVARPMFGLPHVVALGQYVIASRYPLQNCEAGQMGTVKTPHPYLRCQAFVEGKPVTLATAHLVSPRWALTATRQLLTAGLNEWAINLSERLSQAKGLLLDLKAVQGPLILMGDLNAPPESAVIGLLQRLRLRDTFSEAGRGWGYTHGHALHRKTDFLRIDHVLVSQEFVVVGSTVGGSEASQHNPVIADVVLRP